MKDIFQLLFFSPTIRGAARGVATAGVNAALNNN
jgi:hypothetical protein